MFEINYIAKILSDLRIPELIANASKTGNLFVVPLGNAISIIFLGEVCLEMLREDSNET